MDLGKNIKKRREQYDIQQNELAQRLSVSAAMINRIEQGTKDPSVSLLIQIAKALNCTVDELIYDKSA